MAYRTWFISNQAVFWVLRVTTQNVVSLQGLGTNIHQLVVRLGWVYSTEELEAVGISGEFCIFLEASPLAGIGLYFGADFSRWPSLRIWRKVEKTLVWYSFLSLTV